ncbi:hypothetical protein [Undibacterium squillarum]|uniref:hypothetical protein n=1 Tax=Undibacterium squillarum TaxID=1131567 RepID=UPI0035B4021F
MDDFEFRQITLMQQFIEDFKNGCISLNTFIQKIEALISAIDRDVFSALTDSIVLDLEVINATLIDEDRAPTDEENQSISNAFSDLRNILSGCVS